MEEISINGVTGYAGDLDGLDGNNTTASKPQYGVIWYKDGVFYGVEGSIDKMELIKFAESMR
jgi:hypothetical protein